MPDVFKCVAHKLHCLVDHQIRDLLADNPRLNLTAMLQIKIDFFPRLAANRYSVAKPAASMTL
jgi:hypothetical protein